MGRTIIQPIGPLYGEAVNGTVFGRPNGSIYVPSANIVSISLPEAYRYIRQPTASLTRVCNSSGTDANLKANYIAYVAQAQDMSSNIQLQIYEDSECTTLLSYRNLVAGGFNNAVRELNVNIRTVTNGTTYYLRAQLMNNNIPVATSDVIEVVGVAEE